jgi:hypothetical protein
MKAALGFGYLFLVGWAAASADEVPFGKGIPLPGVKGVTSVNVGDLNGDQLPDVAVFEGGKHNDGVQHFAWYEAPHWKRHDFHPDKPGSFIGDSEMADLNRDGWLDVVVPRDNHNNGSGDLYWYENPKGDATGPWKRHTIYADQDDTYHQGDVEVADMDNDGRTDVVCRHLGRRRVRVCLQNGDGSWMLRSFDVRDREGLKLADLDRDGVIDVVMNGFWWAGPKSGWRRGEYTEFTIDAAFFSAKAERLNNSTKNGIGDFNGDGRVDVGLVSAEGNKVYLAVYIAPPDPRRQEWQKIVVKEDFGNCHQLEVADVDLDGDPDLVGGRSFGESCVFVWYNEGGGARWREQTVDRKAGMYSGVVGDLGNDGDVDIIAPNSYARAQTLWIFENRLDPAQ